MRSRTSPVRGLLAASLVAALAVPATTLANTFVATPSLVTNSTGGKNQGPSLDQKGNLVVFVSSVNHVAGVTTSPSGSFDFNNAGNDFTLPGAPHPSPACTNCTPLDGIDGQLFLWRRLQKRSAPGNAITQLTFQVGGAFEANQAPDINQRGTVIAWDSDRDHTGGNPDLNREIFMLDIAAGAITQLTSTTGGGEAANRSVNWRDDGRVLVFDSNRDFTGVLGCKLGDGKTDCGNSDQNSEIMLLNRSSNRIIQITSTTGDMGSANRRPRISNEGRFVAFQSTRNFSGVLPGGATCAQRDGVSPCTNDNNAEIMLYDTRRNAFTQITNTDNFAPCDGTNPNERVEISRGGRFVTWQSRCEGDLNPTGCGSCAGNDEAFLFELKTRSLLQLTISASGFNRVPRIAGKGRWIVLESNRNYLGLDPLEARTLYVLARNTLPGAPGFTAVGQLVADAGSPLAQNPLVNLVGITFAGGFNTTVEEFGASNSGRFFVFDNKKGVGNQEIWFLDRTR